MSQRGEVQGPPPSLLSSPAGQPPGTQAEAKGEEHIHKAPDPNTVHRVTEVERCDLLQEHTKNTWIASESMW